MLEEKDSNADESSSSDDEDMDDGGKETDVLSKLMGRGSAKKAAVVQEVQDAQTS